MNQNKINKTEKKKKKISLYICNIWKSQSEIFVNCDDFIPIFFCFANINQARKTAVLPSNVSLSLSTARSKKNGRLSFSPAFFLLNLLLYSGLSTITIKKNPSKYNKKHKK